MLIENNDIYDDRATTGYLSKHLEMCGFAIHHNMI